MEIMYEDVYALWLGVTIGLGVLVLIAWGVKWKKSKNGN